MTHSREGDLVYEETSILLLQRYRNYVILFYEERLAEIDLRIANLIEKEHHGTSTTN
jgi:hypothetical protein